MSNCCRCPGNPVLIASAEDAEAIASSNDREAANGGIRPTCRNNAGGAQHRSDSFESGSKCGEERVVSCRRVLGGQLDEERSEIVARRILDVAQDDLSMIGRPTTTQAGAQLDGTNLVRPRYL